VFQYIESHPDLKDIVVSGGDAYYLQPEDLREIGERYNADFLTPDKHLRSPGYLA
jgi:L-lysine 2,3-aminomutase